MRKVIFWIHLLAGVVAGVVILIMSVTGVLLTYEKQLVAWADRSDAALPPAGVSTRKPVDELIQAARLSGLLSGENVTGLTISSVAGAPALATAGTKTLTLNPYTGAVLGGSAPNLRAFFRSVTSWHRYIGVDGPWRPFTRALTGWGNVLFLAIVLGGPFLWLPKNWTATQFRNITLFRSGLTSKARDFNWHNVIGIWSFVPLVLIVVGALPISFPWANRAVYQVVGEEVPQPAGQAGGRGAAAGGSAGAPAREGGASREVREGSARREGGERRDARAEGAPQVALEPAWARAERQVDGWRTISTRFGGNPSAPLTFTIDRGTGGQPQLRGTLTIDRATAEAVKWEPFETQTTGRRLRTFLRFAHTGEFFGIAGQTIAGLASAGAAVLVWTGLSLALRRFRTWRGRRQLSSEPISARRSNAA